MKLVCYHIYATKTVVFCSIWNFNMTLSILLNIKSPRWHNSSNTNTIIWFDVKNYILNIFRTFISLLWFTSRSEDMFCRLLLSVVLWSITTRGDLVTKVQDITYQNTDTALLPCDISNTNNPGDRVTLLLWYKEDRNQGGSPIYRIDARTNNNDISIGKK